MKQTKTNRTEMKFIPLAYLLVLIGVVSGFYLFFVGWENVDMTVNFTFLLVGLNDDLQDKGIDAHYSPNKYLICDVDNTNCISYQERYEYGLSLMGNGFYFSMISLFALGFVLGFDLKQVKK